MSQETSPVPVPAGESGSAQDVALQHRKSYRRKYRKIMVKFEQRMRESNTLFKDEQRIYDVSQRLAEQTDQILQLLIELNTCPQVPKRLRYHLSHPSAPKRIEGHRDEQEAFEALRVARQQVQKGEMSLSAYQEMERELLDTVEFAPEKQYADFVKDGIPIRTIDTTTESLNPLAGGLLTSRQEEQYLQSLDAFIDGNSNTPRSHASGNLGHRNAEKSTEREREIQLRNPVSVYNWLRKNQPQVFLQDPENDKSKVAPRTSKRTAARESKHESDLYDEDGVAQGTNSSGRRKRKRDEDGGYRPKGGHARPTKRKREDTGGRRSKRTSMDIGAF